MGQSPIPSHQTQFDRARSVLEDMGVPHGTIVSRHYRVLFTGKRAFATERKSTLEATRRNFLGFMRRLKLRVNKDHELLLVIVLDSERQMQTFYRLASGGAGTLPMWVAGYYSPAQNWAVFYNQRNGEEIERAEQVLNRMAQQLLAVPGGPDTVIHLELPSGPVDRSKRQIARDMEAEWARVISQMTVFNAVVTQHEGAHQIAYNVGVQDRNVAYPFWLSEGLACVFEVPPKKKGLARGAARVNKDRLASFLEILSQHRNLGMEGMILSGKNRWPVDVRAAYAESWAMFAFLFNRHADELSDYMQYLAKRVPMDETVEGHELVVFKRFFKKPLAALQEDFDAYIIALGKRR